MSISMEGVSVAYRRRTIFRDVSCGVGRGQIMGLLGPNGAGKTTLLRVAAGLVRPASGRVHRDGIVMYFGGETTMPGICRADRWSRLLGGSARERRRLRRLSRGTRQLVGLQTVLVSEDWTVGLLDEPWEGLDPEGARWLRAQLQAHRRRGAALMVSSHRLHDVAETCDAYAFLAHGSLRTVIDRPTAEPGVDASTLMKLFDDVARRS